MLDLPELLQLLSVSAKDSENRNIPTPKQGPHCYQRGEKCPLKCWQFSELWDEFIPHLQPGDEWLLNCMKLQTGFRRHQALNAPLYSNGHWIINACKTHNIFLVLLHENKCKPIVFEFFWSNLFLNFSVLFYCSNLCIQIFSWHNYIVWILAISSEIYSAIFCCVRFKGMLLC